MKWRAVVFCETALIAGPDASLESNQTTHPYFLDALSEVACRRPMEMSKQPASSMNFIKAKARIMRVAFPVAFAVTVLASVSFATEPKELLAAKRRYEQATPPGNETARIEYVTAIARIVDKYIEEYRENGDRSHSDDLQAAYAEMKLHPAPGNSDSHTLSALRVGKWSSPRHDYIFKKDGTWSMLPIEELTTHGKWRIEGNQYYEEYGMPSATAPRYTIILLSSRYFVFADKEVVFFESRMTERASKK